jgi:hypothetical protein
VPQAGPQAGAYWVTTGVQTGAGSGHIQLQHPQPLKPIIAVTAAVKMTILFIGSGPWGWDSPWVGGVQTSWEVRNCVCRWVLNERPLNHTRHTMMCKYNS